MYQFLATVVKAFYAAAKGIHEHRRRVGTKHQHLAPLTAQYCFSGLIETGQQLLELAGPRPLDKLATLSWTELQEFNALTQRYISTQLVRLERLHGIVQDQQVIEIFDMSLRREIVDAIGDKEEGLYSVGAGLLFYTVFLKPSTDSSDPGDLERTADIIGGMYPEIEKGVVSVRDSLEALDSLTSAARRYSEVLRLIIPMDQFIPLSKEAAELAMFATSADSHN